MGWLFLIAILVLAVFSRGFRLFLLWTALVVAVIALAWYASSEQREAAPAPRVPIGDLVLEDATLGESGYAHVLRGRLHNRNRLHTVLGVDVLITLRDCTTGPAPTCDVIGESRETLNVRVPAGQARDINQIVSFSNATVRHQMSWTYAIVEVVAQ